MKVKFLSLLAILAIGAAAVLTNCAKDTTTLVPATETGTEASVRGTCNVTITTNGPLDFCGTQTSGGYCPPVFNVWSYGTQSVGAGAHSYTLTTPLAFNITNPTASVKKVTLTTSAGSVDFQLAGGVTTRFVIADDCSFTKIF